LQEVIDAKVAGREVVTPAAEKQDTGAVVDLMAALRASVDAAKPKIARDRNIIIELAVLFSSANPLAPFRYVCTLIEGFSGCVKLLKAQTNERPNKRTNE